MSATRDITNEPTELYRYFDTSDRLLYIGISLSTVARAMGHKREAGWWGTWARSTVERFDTRAQALEAERLAIIREKPLHNVIHNGGNPNGDAPGPAAGTYLNRGLVGRYFLTPDEKHGWPLGNRQGQVIDQFNEDTYLIELYSWMSGGPNGQQMCRLEAMIEWHFYEDDEDWRDAAGDLMRAREWHERDIDREGEPCPHCPNYHIGFRSTLDGQRR